MDAITWIEANDIQDGDDFGAVHRYSNDWYMPKFHVHPHYEFYLFLTGKVQIVIEDEIFDARPMDLFIFPPGTLHRANVLDAHTPYERAYFYVTRQALQSVHLVKVPMCRMRTRMIRLTGSFSICA